MKMALKTLIMKMNWCDSLNIYSYAKITLDKYSSIYSKHTYTQQALFTIMAWNLFKHDSWEISNFILFLSKLKDIWT